MSTKSEIVIKGELIPVYAFDDSGVVEVYLTILNARGQKLESGVALPSNHFGEWLYKVKIGCFNG